MKLLASLCLVLFSLPPLAADERARLETARDGTDHREPAFAAVLENARRDASTDEPALGAPPRTTLLGEPDTARGLVYRIRGVVQQTTRLEPVWGETSEWFVRDDAGDPWLVYVASPEATPDLAKIVGRRVEFDARFYKLVEFTARDGVRRVYPAFVARRPTPAASPTGAGPAALVVGVIALATLFFLIRFGLGRRRGTVRRRGGPAGDLDDDHDLPDDPADALSVLRGRASEGPDAED